MWRCTRNRHDISNLFLALLFLLLGAVAAKAQSVRINSGRVPAQNAEIVRDPADVPASVGTRPATVVIVPLTIQELVATLDPSTGATYRYWTFGGKVPGPMIRVRQGDTVEVRLHNDATSHMVHSVDFHAAIGPGGGAELSQVVPGQSKTFTFQATTPGLFIYHCGTPMIADHIANGMYGLILVEPAGGLPHVNAEYYIMQGEIYTAAPKDKPGLQIFSEAKLMSESPEYFVFNGAVEALSKKYPLHASVGDTIRIFFGNAGPNATSSLHVVGEIFTRDYNLGSLTSPPLNGVSTAGVPPGSAAILELKADTPGQFTFMDHAMSRVAKGLMGTLDVKGQEVVRLMYPGGLAATAEPPALAITSEDSHIAEIKLNNDSHSERVSLPYSVKHPINSKAKQQDGRQAAGVATATSTELNGCLTRDGQMPKLRLFHSTKIYRLQTRAGLLSENPLIFANNFNTLVHVTGRLMHLNDIYDADHSPVFEVNTVNQLAATCNVTESLAQLRHAQQKRSQKPRVASVGATRTNQVHMTDMAFVPASIEVDVGQRVVWQNTSRAIHNVVDDATKALDKTDVALPVLAEPFASAYLQPGQGFARVFSQPGTYRYVCTLHEGNGMKGIIVVRPGGPNTYPAHVRLGNAEPKK
jgi:copper-containing nitrite reductase